MDEHQIPLEELVQRYETNVETGLTTAKADQVSRQIFEVRLYWVTFIYLATNYDGIFLWQYLFLCLRPYIGNGVILLFSSKAEFTSLKVFQGLLKIFSVWFL